MPEQTASVDQLIIMEDFNAQAGEQQLGENEFLGNYSYGKHNSQLTSVWK